MADHGYNSGRLNLPFVGIATFAKKPYVADWNALAADVAIIGAPYDFGAPLVANLSLSRWVADWSSGHLNYWKPCCRHCPPDQQWWWKGTTFATGR